MTSKRSDWNVSGVGEVLPTGTVTLLLADVEGSTRMWDADRVEMTAAVERLNHTVAVLVTTHHGVRPVEQGEGDSFVAAFARASDALACALAIQRAPLAPIRLRIGLHTGEVIQRDEGNYAGPTINRTARLRDLAHGGQTVMSAVVRDLVEDALPEEVWLTDLGTHRLRDLPRPDRVTQLCHPDLRNDFPPLRSANLIGTHNLPDQLTSFVGRAGELLEVGVLLTGNRLVTVTGAGGAGKTRLAVKAAADAVDAFEGGVWFVDLAPITDPAIVAPTVATALGVQDDPAIPTAECIARHLSARKVLVVLDNCEHLLDAATSITSAMLGPCPGLTMLVTSREPLGIPGEVTWRVPSLSLESDARQLFVERARLVQPDFALDADNADVVAEICRRLDGMPLAIELAAARVRALTTAALLDSLHDRFRLLTGGARTATQRQQTLRASVDWSHTLLTEPERVLFRRLAAFSGGFDLTGAQAVAGDEALERFQVLDQLTLLVDKSLLAVEVAPDGTRYALPETLRQYALEKLGESGEADSVRGRHRDHYVARAAKLGEFGHVDGLERELDNFRAAFRWCHERGDDALAMQLASALQPMWLGGGRIREGLTWFEATLSMPESAGGRAARAAALADQAVLDASIGNGGDFDRAEEALAMARESGDPVLLSRVLAACLWTSGRNAEMTQRYLPEALAVARAVGDPHRLAEVLSRQAYAAFMVQGDPTPTREAAAEGLALAESIDARAIARICRWCLATAEWMDGDLAASERILAAVVADAFADSDVTLGHIWACTHSYVLSYMGEHVAARLVSEQTLASAAELGEMFTGIGQIGLAIAAMAAGDPDTAIEQSRKAWQPDFHRETVSAYTVAESARAAGDLAMARSLADEAVSIMGGFHRKQALTVRARIALDEGHFDLAERDVHDGIAICAAHRSPQGLADLLECSARVATACGSDEEAARLLGAAATARTVTGEVRFQIYDAADAATIDALRTALGDDGFDRYYAEGAALTPDEAIAYARRGRGERKRPASGWSALTPAELDVVRLLAEGMPNKDIAGKLFISPRTVQSHLTHVYAKLGLSTRVQLAKEADRRRQPAS